MTESLPRMLGRLTVIAAAPAAHGALWGFGVVFGVICAVTTAHWLHLYK